MGKKGGGGPFQLNAPDPGKLFGDALKDSTKEAIGFWASSISTLLGLKEEKDEKKDKGGKDKKK